MYLGLSSSLHRLQNKRNKRGRKPETETYLVNENIESVNNNIKESYLNNEEVHRRESSKIQGGISFFDERLHGISCVSSNYKVIQFKNKLFFRKGIGMTLVIPSLTV